MIGITHTGKLGDFGLSFPICSWLYKTRNEKIIFILPKDFPFIKEAELLIRIQPFTGDIIYCDFIPKNYDMGGQPYKFNPHDYIKDLNITEYYNLGFRSNPDKNVTKFYAEEYGLGVDEDFILNLDLNFKYEFNDISCCEVIGDHIPCFTKIDFKKDFLTNLQNLAYSKERHLHFSSLAVFLGLAKIPFYLYMIQKKKNFVDITNYDGIVKIKHEDFWLYYSNAPVLDIRELTDDNKFVSIYDKIYFK